MRRHLLVPALLTALAAPLAAQVPVTSGAVDNNNYFGPLGKDSQGSYATALAQRLTAPAGAGWLQSFTFYLTDYFAGDQLFLDAAIYEFDATTNAVTGPALFQSALFQGNSNIFSGDPVTFGGTTPLNVFLSPNTTYAIVVSALDDNGASPDGAGVLLGQAAGNNFGGLLFSQANDLTSQDAFVDVGLPDAAFTAEFSPVATPEPASMTLFATGLASLGGVVARRRKKSRAEV